MDSAQLTIAALLLASVGFGTAGLLDTWRLLRVLRASHPELYASLGRPGLFAGSGVVRLIWRRDSPLAGDAGAMRRIRRLRLFHVLYALCFAALVSLFLAAVAAHSSSR